MKLVKVWIVALVILPCPSWAVLGSISEVAGAQEHSLSPQRPDIQLRLLYAILNRNLESIETLLVKLNHLNYELPVSGSFKTSFDLSFDLYECSLSPLQAAIRISDNNILLLLLSCQKAQPNFCYADESIYWVDPKILSLNKLGRGGDTLLTLFVKCFFRYVVWLSTKDQQPEINKEIVSEHKKMLKMLLDAGALVNQKDVFGYAPLHLVFSKHCFWIEEELLRSGADLDAVISRGAPALCIPEAQGGAAPFLYNVKQGDDQVPGFTLKFPYSNYSLLGLKILYAGTLGIEASLKAKPNMNLTHEVGSNALMTWLKSWNKVTKKSSGVTPECFKRHHDVLDLLLCYKADPMIRLLSGEAIRDKMLGEVGVTQPMKDLLLKYQPNAPIELASSESLSGQKRERPFQCSFCQLEKDSSEKEIGFFCSSCHMMTSLHQKCYEQFTRLSSGRIVCPACQTPFEAAIWEEDPVQEGV